MSQWIGFGRAGRGGDWFSLFLFQQLLQLGQFGFQCFPLRSLCLGLAHFLGDPLVDNLLGVFIQLAAQLVRRFGGFAVVRCFRLDCFLCVRLRKIVLFCDGFHRLSLALVFRLWTLDRFGFAIAFVWCGLRFDAQRHSCELVQHVGASRPFQRFFHSC